MVDLPQNTGAIVIGKRRKEPRKSWKISKLAKIISLNFFLYKQKIYSTNKYSLIKRKLRFVNSFENTKMNLAGWL